MKSQADMARELAPLLGKDNVRTVAAFLNQLVLGKRPVPEDWEPPLMEVSGLSTRSELLAAFPRMRFHNDHPKDYAGEPCEYEVSIVTTSSGVVPAERIADILHTLRVLEHYGIKTEVRVIKKES